MILTQSIHFLLSFQVGSMVDRVLSLLPRFSCSLFFGGFGRLYVIGHELLKAIQLLYCCPFPLPSITAQYPGLCQDNYCVQDLRSRVRDIVVSSAPAGSDPLNGEPG